MTTEKILSMLQSDNISLDNEIRISNSNQKSVLTMYVKNYPYHNDSLDFITVDCLSKTIEFFEQHRIIFQEFIEKIFKNKDDYLRLNNCYKLYVENNNSFSSSSKKMLVDIIENVSAKKQINDIKSEFLSLFELLKFKYIKPKDNGKETVSFFVDKTIKAIAGQYTESLINNHKLVFSFEEFDRYYSENANSLRSAFKNIIKSVLGFLFGKQITEKIKSLLDSKFLNEAELNFSLNNGDENSALISLNNNPWRNGIIKGDMLFAKIKAEGKAKYILFKDVFSYKFYKEGINYTANKTERDNGLIRIDLNAFMECIQHSNETFQSLMTAVFLRAISFKEFGCCSKYAECEKEGKCLHCDQLYATACQWQKYLKRTDKFE